MPMISAAREALAQPGDCRRRCRTPPSPRSSPWKPRSAARPRQADTAVVVGEDWDARFGKKMREAPIAHRRNARAAVQHGHAARRAGARRVVESARRARSRRRAQLDCATSRRARVVRDAAPRHAGGIIAALRRQLQPADLSLLAQVALELRCAPRRALRSACAAAPAPAGAARRPTGLPRLLHGARQPVGAHARRGAFHRVHQRAELVVVARRRAPARCARGARALSARNTRISFSTKASEEPSSSQVAERLGVDHGRRRGGAAAQRADAAPAWRRARALPRCRAGAGSPRAARSASIGLGRKASAPGLERLALRLRRGVGRKHDHRQPLAPARHQAQRLQRLDAAHAGHVAVEDHEVVARRARARRAPARRR